MKRFLIALLMLVSLLAVISLGSRICAADAQPTYIIDGEDGEYLLSVHSGEQGSPLIRSGKIEQIIAELERTSEGGRLLFRDTIIKESFELSKKYTVSGTLTLAEGAILSVSCDTAFSDLNMEIISGQVRIKEGRVDFSDTEISSCDGEAVVLDYSSSASLLIRSGKIISSGVAIKNTLGRVEILGGGIRSDGAVAIENSATLVLSSNPEIVGREVDISTASEITLKGASGEFSANAKIIYDALFKQGEIRCVFYSASENSIKGIEFFDKNKNQMAITCFDSFVGVNERNFGAVYLPHVVRFYSDKTLIKTSEIVHGVGLEAPSIPNKEGYRFLGYTENEGGANLYDFANNVNKSFDLYAKYELLPPSFELSSLEFAYDGASHLFGIENLSHPLLDKSIVSYIWYKDGSYFRNWGPKISLEKVSESGKYYAEITLTYGQDTVKIITPEVFVNIKKQEISIPEIPEKQYNGEKQLPDIYSTNYYSVTTEGGDKVGKYVVTLRLLDGENTEFSGGLLSVNLDFSITRAENFWTDTPSVSDLYENSPLSIEAAARFGEVKYLFSNERDGTYSEEVPSLVGNYYVIAYVPESENYTELKSEPLPFSVIADGAVGLSVYTSPEKTEYTAFESFSARGLSLLVTYASGRCEIIEGDRVKITYQSAPSFRYADTAVIVSYLDCTVGVPVSVNKAKYDLSAFSFTDTEYVYNSESRSISPRGAIPTGLDGIPLSYSIIGSGKNVGTYTVALTFSSDSKNYEIPSSLEARLVILPKEVTVYFENTEFTYDGDSKCPTAYYIDLHGRKISLSVSGARSHAGEYTAVASGENSNYTLLSATRKYKINKAYYDLSGAFWSEADYTYDGSEKEVYVTGLPLGIQVVGYSDARAREAGKYTAAVSVIYDEKNYNPPEIPIYTWEIQKADYDISGIEILNTCPIYSGEVNYPEIKGKMPVGLDGISLEYSFSGGATHVFEGKVFVEIIFSTKSKNYNVPEKMTASVEVMPLGIYASWQTSVYTYNMSEQAPTASANDVKVRVVGGGKNAGKYTVTAISLDSDYYVINDKFEYEILRAQNHFTKSLTVEDVFEGKEPLPEAEALGGKVRFLYYTEQGELLSEYPKLHGRYYVVAECDGGENYLPIKSEPVFFNLIKIVPVSLFAKLNKTVFTATEQLLPSDFVLYYSNNDGSEARVTEQIKIEYEAGECLLFGNGTVTLKAGGLECLLTLSVKKADYDLSGVFWTASEFTYDGREKSVLLSGLPDGISVKEYIGNLATGAGEYTASAILSYDGENYNPPIISAHSYVIKKQTVPYPALEPLTYNGKEQSPKLENPLYLAVFEKGVDKGSYEAEILLFDPDNYELPNKSDRAKISYEILPRSITIELSRVDKYLLSKMPSPSYMITDGEVILGDELLLSFIYEKSSVGCVSGNPNYDITVIPGRLVRHNFFARGTVFLFCLIFLLLVTLTLVVLVLVMRKKEIIHYFAALKCRFSPVAKSEEGEG